MYRGRSPTFPGRQAFSINQTRRTSAHAGAHTQRQRPRSCFAYTAANCHPFRHFNALEPRVRVASAGVHMQYSNERHQTTTQTDRREGERESESEVITPIQHACTHLQFCSRRRRCPPRRRRRRRARRPSAPDNVIYSVG